MKRAWQMGRSGPQIGKWHFLKIVLMFFLIATIAGAASAATLYVGAGLESSGDGTSWATAYASLEDALDNAADGDDIWMQGGTYPLDTYLSIYNVNNVSIYGGFSGTETALSQRDLAANATILDGSSVLYSDMITIESYNTSGIVIDGITIANYSSTGTAMRIPGSPTIRNCNFFNNTTSSGEGTGSTTGYYGGAAMLISGGAPVIVNCVFAHNTATYGYGGAVNMRISSADFINCTFTRNTAIDGGAVSVYSDNGTNNEFYNCLFWGNTVDTASYPQVDIDTGAGTSYTANYNFYASSGDPLLVDPDNGNYHLSPGSPCIDAGTGSVSLASVDMDGDTRVIDGDENGDLVVDIGADEFDPTQQYYADIYVDAAQSDDSGDGTTWAKAKATLQGAIDAAVEGDEIWVRTGTYSPIVIDRAVSIYGGFVGSEIQRIGRNPETYPTAIDGQGSARCVEVTGAAVMDGFTITNGYSSNGGGILISNSGATIANCIIDGNASPDYAGGVYFSSPATMENCEITNNQANTGGGIYNGYVSSTVSGCLIEGNSANNGGGIFNDGGFAPEITNCTIKSNYATVNGGGICNDEKNDAVISGCTIVLNTATGRGGGIFSGQESSSNTLYAEPEISNSVIANNWATWGGGLYCAAYSRPEIINNTIAGNTAATGGAGVYVVDAYSQTRIMNSVLYGNVLDAGGYADIYYNGSTEANLALLYNSFSVLDESWHNSGTPIRTGNIAGIAGFINYNGPDGDPLAGGDSNYHIIETSDLVDQGVASYTISVSVTLVAPDHDLEDNARPQGGGVDIGAYESGYTATVTQYTLTASVSGSNGTVTPTTGTYADGTTVTLTATPASGYRVASWNGTSDDSSTGTTNTVVMDSNKIVTVSFESIPVTQYSLTASVSGGNGTVSPTTGTYDDGTTVTLTATPASGYRVASWSGTSDDSATTAANTVVMDGNKTVTVTFEVIPPTQYTLTASVSGGNGTVSPTSGTYDGGTTVTLAAAAASGYQVASWSGTSDDSATTTTNTVIMNADKTVSVTFESIPAAQYTLTVQVEGQGSASPANGSVYDDGTTVDLTATPEAHWMFDGWSGNVADTDASSTTIFMDADQSITAVFVADSDEDSVPDDNEFGPNGDDPTYDGNGDGTADSEQGFVVSGRNYSGDQYVTIEFPETATIDEISVIETPPGAPDDVAFTWDCFRFALDGLASGSAIQVMIFLPEGAEAVSYYKYGPTTDDTNPHWYEFLYDGSTGAEINGNEITLHLVDGQRGDDDLSVNGSILDDGGPVLAVADSDAATGDGGSSGCFISTAGTSGSIHQWGPGIALFCTILLFIAGFGIIQRD